MRNKETLRKLAEMHLSGMVELYEEQTRNSDYQDMTFDQRFNLLVDYEYSRRQSNKLNRLIKSLLQCGIKEQLLQFWFS